MVAQPPTLEAEIEWTGEKGGRELTLSFLEGCMITITIIIITSAILDYNSNSHYQHYNHHSSFVIKIIIIITITTVISIMIIILMIAILDYYAN